ncbi:MAG: hypothetical protein ACYC6N_08755 [Pirellulaceae bacterium]
MTAPRPGVGGYWEYEKLPIFERDPVLPDPPSWFSFPLLAYYSPWPNNDRPERTPASLLFQENSFENNISFRAAGTRDGQSGGSRKTSEF